MLIRVGTDQVIFAFRMASDPDGFRLFDRVGNETRIDLGDRSSLKMTDDGTLLLGGVDKVSDPHSDGGNEYEAEEAVGGLVVTGGQSAAVFQL